MIIGKLLCMAALGIATYLLGQGDETLAFLFAGAFLMLLADTYTAPPKE